LFFFSEKPTVSLLLITVQSSWCHLFWSKQRIRFCSAFLTSS
jgi:hypothetical protein